MHTLSHLHNVLLLWCWIHTIAHHDAQVIDRRTSDWSIERTIEKYLENRLRWDFLVFTIEFLMLKNIYEHTFTPPWCVVVVVMNSYNQFITLRRDDWKKGGKIEKKAGKLKKGGKMEILNFQIWTLLFL